MSEIVAAFASSHSIMLTCQLEDWQGKFEKRDASLQYFDRNGNPTTYADLLKKAPKDAANYITKPLIARRYAEVNAAMDRMRKEIRAANLDVIVICGDDQHELFKSTLMPPIAIYYGKSIRNAVREKVPEGDWFREARMRRLEDTEDMQYPVHEALASHLIKGLGERHFDITAMRGLTGDQFEGHAFSFIHRIYMDGMKIPVVPIMLNTFYPPNPPSSARCVALGEALGELIASYPEKIRVGFVASGGLSHFQAEEDLDGLVIEALKRKDLKFLSRLDERRLQSGSSEIRNWLALAGAAKHLDLDWLSYTPAYRTPALTGTGLGFAIWKQPKKASKQAKKSTAAAKKKPKATARRPKQTSKGRKAK